MPPKHLEIVRRIYDGWAAGDFRSALETSSSSLRESPLLQSDSKPSATQSWPKSSSGIEGKNSYFHLFTFRGEKVVRIEVLLHERDALERLG